MRTFLQYGWNDLASEKEMLVGLQVVGVVVVQVLATKGLGGGTREQPVV